MKVKINVDELRTIAPLAIDAAEKMNITNNIITGIVSTHDWKCPERVAIDEELTKIKDNSNVLNNAFVDFSNSILEIANDYTDFINEQKRFDIGYSEDVGSLLAKMGSYGATSTVSSGEHMAGIVSNMAASSMYSPNIMSLSGASNGINIVDFSLFLK